MERNDLESLLDKALHDMGLCECQEDGSVPKVKELRDPGNNKFRAKMAERATQMGKDIESMATLYNNVVDLIAVLDKDPDPSDREAMLANKTEQAVFLIKLIKQSARD